MDTTRAVFRGGITEDMSKLLEQTISELRGEVETGLAVEKPLVKRAVMQTRHLTHFVTVRNRGRAERDVCMDCVKQVTKMWTTLQMHMHVAVGEILEWADWNDIPADDLYDSGIRGVFVTDEMKRELLGQQRFV